MMLWIALPSLVLTLINGLIFYRLVAENYSSLVDLSPMTEEAKNVLYGELRETSEKILVLSTAFVLSISALSLFFSHQIVGSLEQLKNAFRRVKEGDSQVKVRFRTQDEFQDIAAEFNSMMEKLKK